MNEYKLPSEKNFGLTFAVIFLIIGFFFHYIFYIFSFIFFFISFTKPELLKKLNVLWFKFGIFLSKIFTPIIMGFVFFCVVTPIGLIMKYVFSNNLLNLKKNKVISYWVKKKEKINFNDQF